METIQLKELEMRIDKNMWNIRTRKYYVVMKMNKVWIHLTTWMTFRNMILNKRSQLQKNIYYKILFKCY